jgi:hypothetical protein
MQAYIWARCVPEPMSGCWLWAQSVNQDGYGKACTDENRRGAHRASYEAFRGDIPDGLSVCHKCDTPSCVNPDHFFLGTFAENMKDKVRKGRLNTCRGDRNGMTRIPDETVREIKRQLALGAGRRGTQSRLSREYGVDKTTISGIALGKSRRSA